MCVNDTFQLYLSVVPQLEVIKKKGGRMPVTTRLTFVPPVQVLAKQETLHCEKLYCMQ